MKYYKLDKSLLPKIIDESSIKFNNLVLESNIGDNKEINLEYLFKNFVFAENTDVLFLHYYDNIKIIIIGLMKPIYSQYYKS